MVDYHIKVELIHEAKQRSPLPRGTSLSPAPFIFQLFLSDFPRKAEGGS